MRWLKGLLALAGLVAIVVVVIGPDIVLQLAQHGTTTVWDHREYPTRVINPSDDPSPWQLGTAPDELPGAVDGDLAATLQESGTLGFLVVREGRIVSEWYGESGGRDVRSMLFSVSKSIVSLLIGAAIDDGLIGAVDDPVSAYVPELAGRGFDDVTVEDLLRMDSSIDYVEDDNPFGIHIPFNYTRDLRPMIMELSVREERDRDFRYKSGDNALLGLVLERALDGPTLTAYLENRLWEPMGAMHPGSWNVDHEGGFERTWCCLAMTARELARFGQLVVRDGNWDGEQLISASWLDASFEPGFAPDRWPPELAESPLDNYGYQWWLLDDGSPLALGKDGQYLFIDRDRDVIIVRLGEARGEVPWTRLMQDIAAAT